MHLVQMLLPLRAPDGSLFRRAELTRVRRELTERFGGATAFVNSPAEGAWKEESGDVERDQVVVVEVMVEELDREWWRGYREELRERFGQEELVVRGIPFERL